MQVQQQVSGAPAFTVGDQVMLVQYPGAWEVCALVGLSRNPITDAVQLYAHYAPEWVALVEAMASSLSNAVEAGDFWLVGTTRGDQVIICPPSEVLGVPGT